MAEFVKFMTSFPLGQLNSIILRQFMIVLGELLVVLKMLQEIQTHSMAVPGVDVRVVYRIVALSYNFAPSF